MKASTLQSWTLAVLLMPSAQAASLLLRRAPACAATAGLEACPAGIDFCCPTGTTCTPTTSANSTVVCCPTGKDCSAIQPITCDISQQNAQLYPNNLLHTADLSFKMPACNGSSTCCPAGFSCQGSLCLLTSRLQPPSSSSGSSTQAIMTSTPTAPVTIPSATTAPKVPNEQPAEQSKGTPAGFIALAVLLSLAGAACIGLAIVWCLKRRKRQQPPKPSASPDFMGSTPRTPNVPEMRTSTAASAKNTPPRPHHGPQPSSSSISQPILLDQFGGSQRTDFLRRGDSQSGFERKNKPLWSKLNDGAAASSAALARSLSRKSVRRPDVERGRTRKVVDASVPTVTSSSMTRPFTPTSQAASDVSAPRRKSLFVKPLRLPLANPSTTTREPPVRPPRSGGLAPGLAAATYTSQGAREQSTSARRDSLHGARRANGGQSFDSTSSIDSDNDLDSPTKDFRSRDASSETINVLMPPPSLYSHARNDDPNRQTTFTDLMVQAGWKTPDSRR